MAKRSGSFAPGTFELLLVGQLKKEKREERKADDEKKAWEKAELSSASSVFNALPGLPKTPTGGGSQNMLMAGGAVAAGGAGLAAAYNSFASNAPALSFSASSPYSVSGASMLPAASPFANLLPAPPTQASAPGMRDPFSAALSGFSNGSFVNTLC